MKNANFKKLFAGLSSVAMLASAMPVIGTAVQAADTNVKTVYGDANEDNEVNIADAVLILQTLSNPDKYTLTTQGKDNADVDERGNGITAKDALAIQMYEGKAVDSLPLSWAQGNDPDPVSSETYIHLQNTAISVEGDYAEVSGTTVTINHSGSFYVDGTLDDGQIVVNIADETADPDTVKIFLNGVNITGKSDSAILITNAENTSINLVDGTENYVSDGDTAYASGNAVIEAKDDLTIKGGDLGTGKLILTANTQNGIVCNNDIKITGGVVDITTLNATDKTNGINGKTSLTVKGGTVTVDAEGDGIKSSKGSVAISDGSVSIKAGNDAVQAETSIDISGGTVVAGGDRGLTSITGVNITGGTVVATATDNQIDSSLLTSSQGTMLLNCIACADTTDGTWKKANSITVGNVSASFTKKYSYVLISDSSVSAGSSYTLTNASTGATVTYNNDANDSFAQSAVVTTYDNVNPAGKDGGTVITDPVTEGYTITLSGTSILTNAPSDVASVSNGVLTITKEGIFEVTGSGSETQIVVDVDKTLYPTSIVELDLAGMSLTNTSTSPIYVASVGDEVQIVAKNGTENTISDGTNYTNADADQGAIYSKDDLKFKGKGTLTVNGNAADAIVGKDDVRIYNGTLIVNAVDDGIRGKDSVVIGKADDTDYSSLSVTVKTNNGSTGGDGIKSTNDTDSGKGIVTINGGTVNINAYSDGIQAQQDFVMNGGDVTIYTYQGSGYTGSGSASTTDPGSTQPGRGSWGGGSGGMGMDGNANKTDISAKGIKSVGIYDETGTTWQSMGNLTINGGTLNIDSSDDSIHCGGDMKLLGGEMTLATADDGAHSDHSLTIGQGSATTYDDVKILVTKGYEGIEAQQIVQNSGSAIINVTDDGYNAGGGSDGSGAANPGGPNQGWNQGTTGGSGSYSLTINGGFALVNVASGDHDGFDSNGTITMTGGIAVTNGNEPFDSDGSISFTGGVWIENSASSGSYMDTQPSYSVTGGSVNQGERITLVGSNGQVIVSFTAGKSVSTLRAGGDVSGASFYTGGTLSSSTYFIDGQEHAYGGTLSGGTASSGSSSSNPGQPW